MPEVGSAYVRIRPTLHEDEREALQTLAVNARALADGLDSFLSNFPARRAEVEQGSEGETP